MRHVTVGAILFSFVFITALVTLVSNGLGNTDQSNAVSIPTHIGEASQTALTSSQPDTTAHETSDAFSIAVASGDIASVKAQLAQGADLERENDADGRTPLFVAVGNMRLDMASFLLEKGANVQAQDKFGMTPLHVAVQSRQKEMVALLLKHAANPNARDARGISPFQLARANSTPEVVQLLQDSGAHD
jgi:ankyrin repeat protein